MNKNLHLKVGSIKILAITILTISILGGCSSTTKDGPILPFTVDASSNSIVPEGDVRATHTNEIISKAYDSDNKYYDFTSNLTKPFLEKLDSIDKFASEIPYFKDSMGKSFSQRSNSKIKELMYVRELPTTNTSDSLRKLSLSLGINEGEKPLTIQTSFTLSLMDNNNLGDIILSEKEKSILNIIYPTLDIAQIQSNLSQIYKEKLTPTTNSISTEGKYMITLNENTFINFVAYETSESTPLIVNISIIETSTYKK